MEARAGHVWGKGGAHDGARLGHISWDKGRDLLGQERGMCEGKSRVHMGARAGNVLGARAGHVWERAGHV